jgi:hypothetical protein
VECKTRILISWVFLAAGILLTIFSNAPYEISAFTMLPFLFLRSTKEDKEYYKNIGKKSGVLLKLSFLWMLSWLIYVLYNYYQTVPIGVFTLSSNQLFLFISPLLLIFVIYEVIWFISCKKA